MSLYTHILRGQESEAIAKLPDLSKPSKQRKSKGTGTNGLRAKDPLRLRSNCIGYK